MKLRAGLMMACLGMLVAFQANADIREYTFRTNQFIHTLSEPFGVLIAKGTWEGANQKTVIDDCNGCSTPSLIRTFTHSTFTRTFDTASTTGSPGTYGFVEVDSRAVAGGPFPIVGTRTDNAPNPGNVTISFGPVPAKATGGKGQRCTDGPPGAATGGCAVAGLGPTWAASIPPVNPITANPTIFATTALDTYTMPGSFLYFDLRPALAVDIYGFYVDGEGEEIPPVPVFAPIGALALGGSLIFMGARTLRKRD